MGAPPAPGAAIRCEGFLYHPYPSGPRRPRYADSARQGLRALSEKEQRFGARRTRRSKGSLAAENGDPPQISLIVSFEAAAAAKRLHSTYTAKTYRDADHLIH
jgi:hypothetical protein